MALPCRGYSSLMRGARDLGPRAASLRALGAVALLAALTAGCTTGQPASHSAWQSSSHRALGQAISGLGTARVALQVESADRAPHTYTVVTATDAIESTDKEVSGYQVAQPPDDLHHANKVVGQALDDAVSLLVDVRVALASPGIDAAGARALIDRIDAERKKLDDLDKAVQSSPESVQSGSGG